MKACLFSIRIAAGVAKNKAGFTRIAHEFESTPNSPQNH